MTGLKHIRNIPHFYIIRSVELKLLSYYINKTERPFLDLGCGDGSFSRNIGLKEVYGIDIDDKAVNEAAKSGCYKELLIANASQTPFPDAFFGTVFSNCAIEHMDGLSNVLKEVRRVLKDSGKFIFTVPSRNFLQVLKNDEILKGIGLNRDDSIAKYNEFHHHVNMYDLKEWKEILEAARFKLLDYEYYLSGNIGSFVAQMDMLYTIEAFGSKELLSKLEKKYRSISGLLFRMKCKRYIANPHNGEPGTHLLIKVEKS